MISKSSEPLQTLIWPDHALCNEPELYFHLTGAVSHAPGSQILEFDDGGQAAFGTYFNYFSIGKWVEHCSLQSIQLALHGSGKLEVLVYFSYPGKTLKAPPRRTTLIAETISLTPGKPSAFNLSHFADTGRPGVLHFELRALGPATLTDAVWQSTQKPLRQPDLALIITTYKREEAIRKTVQRFEDFFFQGSPLQDHVHLTVIDNGQSAEISDSAFTKSIHNENYGGSGGFARGFLEARQKGASHCLFMDDDAAIHMQSLERTWRFLAYATDPATAIAGALTCAGDQWKMWENGAVFEGVCVGLFRGADLREPEEITGMELASCTVKLKNMYGAWWFYAFSVDQVKYLPFPFFVRGDDVSFSLANDFNIVTLQGVAAFQDINFDEKENPQTVYLDLRSHLAHHLALPSMDYGRIHLAWVALRFAVRALVRHHYETISALTLAVEDVLVGPQFFAEHADHQVRRRDIQDIITEEIWAVHKAPPDAGKLWEKPRNLFLRIIMKLTLNGLLIPFFSRFGNSLTISAKDRTDLSLTWGAAQITYLDTSSGKSYTVRHSKSKGFGLSARFLKKLGYLLWTYSEMKTLWQQGYNELTSDDQFWVKTLGVTFPPPNSPEE